MSDHLLLHVLWHRLVWSPRSHSYPLFSRQKRGWPYSGVSQVTLPLKTLHLFAKGLRVKVKILIYSGLPALHTPTSIISFISPFPSLLHSILGILASLLFLENTKPAGRFCLLSLGLELRDFCFFLSLLVPGVSCHFWNPVGAHSIFIEWIYVEDPVWVKSAATPLFLLQLLEAQGLALAPSFH